jgi:hypothetical protein
MAKSCLKASDTMEAVERLGSFLSLLCSAAAFHYKKKLFFENSELALYFM